MTSIIFDEVDTGVSGRVAQAIADKISQISKYSQVLCITHLPQVAAVADYQYYIVKAVIDGRTQTSVSELKTKEREEEIARMLAGSEITKLTLEHAKELLKLAKGPEPPRSGSGPFQQLIAIFYFYMTLITAVNTTDPIVKISIVQMTNFVTLAKVLVCFFHALFSTSSLIS